MHNVFDEFILDKTGKGTCLIDCHTGTTGSIKTYGEIYPNPSNGWINVEVPPGERFSCCIFNGLGKMISEVQDHGAMTYPLRIDLADQPPGIYFLKLKTGKEISFGKIILTK